MGSNRCRWCKTTQRFSLWSALHGNGSQRRFRRPLNQRVLWKRQPLTCSGFLCVRSPPQACRAVSTTYLCVRLIVGRDKPQTFAALIEWRARKEQTAGKFLLGAGSGGETAEAPEVRAAPEASDGLLSSVDDDFDAEGVAAEMDPFFKPNLTISLVNDFAAYTRSQMQPQMLNAMHIDEDTSSYYPNVLISEFWLLRVRIAPALPPESDL